MPTVQFSKVLEAPAAQVWAVVRDFEALATWFPFITHCELKDPATAGQVGAVRINTTAEGALIEEILLELSDRDRRIVYAVTKGDVATLDYSATLTIHEVTADGRAYADWTARFDVAGDPAPVVAWVRDDIFKTCLEELERVVQQRPQ